MEDKINAFLKEYGELVEKHKVDFAQFPMYLPDGEGGFKTIIRNQPMDISDQPVKSPFIQSDDKKS